MSDRDRILLLRKEPPVTQAKLATMRRHASCVRPYAEWEIPASECVHALLALADWQEQRAVLAECALQDALAEDGRYAAGVRAGVAQAVEAARRRGQEYSAEVLGEGLARIITEGCDPAELPPHAETYAECQRLKAALAEILPFACDDGPGNYLQIRELARKALEGAG